MTGVQLLVFLLLASWFLLTMRGGLAIIRQTFMPDSGDIVVAFCVSGFVHGIIVALLGGLAALAMRVV